MRLVVAPLAGLVCAAAFLSMSAIVGREGALASSEREAPQAQRPAGGAPSVPGGAGGATAGAAAPAPADATAGVRDYPIRPVPLTAVRFTDVFWRPRLEVNRTVTIPHILKQNELTGRVANFLRAAKKAPGAYQGQRYNDTDVYTVIEAASYVLAAAPDPALDTQIDDLIAIVAAAQEPDGYLYTPRSVDPSKPAPGAGAQRWSSLHTSHELYNAGHMYEAAVAHFRATKKRTLLDVAVKHANLVCAVFGPSKRRDVPGHQEIELALVKLYDATGDRRYLDQARFFLEERGRPHSVTHAKFPPKDRFAIYNDVAYRQDHAPLAQQRRAVGHAVRATYMYAGMTDVAARLGVAPFGRALDALWQDVATKRVYVTGGLGSQGRTEGFGDDYALPNDRAYAETCASIGGLLWYHRMFLRGGDASYVDLFERTLYNGYLSGVSLAGDAFFYQNPLASDGRAQRSAYFDVACCPANLARLMAQLPGLVYAQRDASETTAATKPAAGQVDAGPAGAAREATGTTSQAPRSAVAAASSSGGPASGTASGQATGPEVFVNLYVGSEANLTVGGTAVRLVQETQYPWQGRVTLRVGPAAPATFTLALRVPGWARGEEMPAGDLYRTAPAARSWGAPTLKVNGETVSAAPDRGYARIRRAWNAGDVVQLDLPMPVRRVLAHDGVTADRGRAAIARGPLVYAVEAVDNDGAVSPLQVPLDAVLQAVPRKDMLNGVTIIIGGSRIVPPAGTGKTAAPGATGKKPDAAAAPRDHTLIAVPYFAWANRGKGEMAVWLPYR